MEQPSNIRVRISLSSYLRVLVVLFLLLLVWALREIIIVLFVSMILAAAISPWIRGLTKLRLPRPVGVLIVYVGLLGIIAVVIILYGGFIWMTAAGNEERVDKARKMIVAGVIGLAIILSAYAIARFVVNSLVNATS